MAESGASPLLRAVVALATEDDPRDTLRRIAEAACTLTGARGGAVAVYETGDVITAGSAELLPAATVLRPLADVPDEVVVPARSAVAAPIRVGDDVHGVLYLAEKATGEFGADDREIAATLAAAAGMAVENVGKYRRTHARDRWLTAAHEVTRALLTGADLDTTLYLIAERARTVAAASVGAVVRPSIADPDTLVFEVVASPIAEHRALAGVTVPVEGTASGLAFATRETVAVRRYGDHVVSQQSGSAVTMPATIKDLDSAVAVPLTVGPDTLGVLMVAKFGDLTPFAEDEIAEVREFAVHAALTLEFTRAEADRQKLAVFRDRDRIARDLHDLVIQRLFAVALGLEGLKRAADRPELADGISGFVRDLDRTIREIRNSIFSLQEPAEAHGGLRSELLGLAHDSAAVLGFEPRVAFDGPVDTAVTGPIRADLLAVVREALSNVARHAAASSASVEIVVDRDGQRLDLRVTDDGAGPGDEPGKHSGLANLSHRAARWGGSSSLRHTDEGGTTLTWSVELANPSQGAS